MILRYIANSRIPTEKAHGIQIMKTCEALAMKGQQIELIIPYRNNPITEDPFLYYDIKPCFKITTLYVPDLIDLGRVGFLIQSLIFSIRACIYILLHADRKDVVFSRDELPLYLMSLMKRTSVWEVHDGHFNFLIKRIIKRCTYIIAITQGLATYYISKGAEAKKFIIAPDGVDLNSFIITISKNEAREKLQIDPHKKLVLYTGHLYTWKGVDTLALAAELLPEYEFLFVGGTLRHIDEFKHKYGHIKNIVIAGQKPHKEMPLYLKAADIVSLPNSANFEISKHYTSPIKLFEYMASGTPIVASDLPSIREILNEENAILVEPDNVESLKQGIVKIFTEYENNIQKAERALENVQHYSWHQRALRILSSLQSS